MAGSGALKSFAPFVFLSTGRSFA